MKIKTKVKSGGVEPSPFRPPVYVPFFKPIIPVFGP